MKASGRRGVACYGVERDGRASGLRKTPKFRSRSRNEGWSNYCRPPANGKRRSPSEATFLVAV